MALGDKKDQLSERRKQALQKGGPEHMAARGRRGAMTARERVLGVLDPGTFVELDLFVDGVVAGHGLVDGREVYVFSQGWTNDPRRRAGSGPEVPSACAQGAVAKIVKVTDLALMSGAPIIGLYDCGVDEPRRGSGGYTDVFLHNVMASGLVPQISAIMGPCLGGAAYPVTMTDFVIMVKGTSHLSVTLPAAGSPDEEPTLEELAGALAHSTKSGVAHLTVDDEAQCLKMIRRLIAYVPQNNLESSPIVQAGDPLDRKDQALAGLAPESPGAGEGYDMRNAIKSVMDGGEFLELMSHWAENVVIGFARLAGRAVGVVGNQPMHGEGRLDNDASVKAARFIRFCDAFNIPVVTFVDTPGFVGGAAQEHGGAARHGAKLLCAYCEATVPKLTVVTGRAYDEGYEVMGSKGVRADFCIAWPTADLRVPGLAPAEQGASAASGSLLYLAAEGGLLDDIIQPEETRPRLAAALRACISKREGRPPKKHGNIPL
jgi:propionyl-CoA carboxylase beta chain